MIGYILISYVVMFISCFYLVVFTGEELKANFKWWLFSPLTLPLCIISAVINW